MILVSLRQQKRRGAKKNNLLGFVIFSYNIIAERKLWCLNKISFSLVIIWSHFDILVFSLFIVHLILGFVVLISQRKFFRLWHDLPR